MSRTNLSGIAIHAPEEYESMRRAGRLAAEVLDFIIDYVKPEVTTDELNKLCHNMITKRGAIPAPLDYRGFPKSICTSVNHVVCHGIPDNKKLREGDTLNIDVTVIIDGWHGDTSRMFWVGDKVPIKAKRLSQITYDATMLGIEQVRPGATLGDIGHIIQKYAEGHNYSVVKEYCGHGLGKIFHAPPNVLHFGEAGTGMTLEEGMFFTVEPMLNAGKPGIRLHDDGWTVTTKDRSLSAQFEHSLGVTSDGFEIFTESPKGLSYPPY